MFKLNTNHSRIKSTVWIVAMAVSLLGSQIAGATECACMVKQIRMPGYYWDLSIKCLEVEKTNHASCQAACATLAITDHGTAHMSISVIKDYTRISTYSVTYGAMNQCSDDLYKLYPSLSDANL